MSFLKTKFRILDNSGAKKALIIGNKSSYLKQRVFNNSKLVVGSIVKVTIFIYAVFKKIKKKQLFFSLIITSKKQQLRKNGSYVRFDRTSGILLNNLLKPLGSRILTPISKNLRKNIFLKRLAQNVI